jgi:hypothetical protein
MKSVKKVSLSTVMDDESLDFSFLSTGNVEIQIQTYNKDTDSFESKIVEIPKEEWEEFLDYLAPPLENDDKAERKCGGCGSSGHNSRTCPLLKRPDPE